MGTKNLTKETRKYIMALKGSKIAVLCFSFIRFVSFWVSLPDMLIDNVSIWKKEIRVDNTFVVCGIYL